MCSGFLNRRSACKYLNQSQLVTRFCDQRAFLPGFSCKAGNVARLGLQLLAAQRPARTFASRFAVRPPRASVDKDMLDARRRRRRHFEGRPIGDGLRVEDGYVGIGARFKNTATGETESISGQAGHSAHRLFEAEQTELAAVIA